MRDRLECKTRGASVSIVCGPDVADTSCTGSVNRLAASWTASWSDIECKNVRVIVISRSRSKIKSKWSNTSDQTHGRQLFPGFLLGIATESNSKMRTKKKVRCCTWVYASMSTRRTKSRIWILRAQHLKNRSRQIFDEQGSQSCIGWSLKEANFRECSTYNMTTTDLFMNQIVPSYVFVRLVSMRHYHLLGIGEMSTIIHIHSIADTGFDFWIVMNYIIDLGFFDLPFGPIWETGLWIPLPASIAFFRAMVTFFWDRRCDALELFGIDSCELH